MTAHASCIDHEIYSNCKTDTVSIYNRIETLINITDFSAELPITIGHHDSKNFNTSHLLVNITTLILVSILRYVRSVIVYLLQANV